MLQCFHSIRSARAYIRPRTLAVVGAVFVSAILISKYADNDLSFSLAQAYAGHGSVVNLYVDGGKRIVSTDAGTVGDVLTQFHVTLGPNDVVEPAADTPVNQLDFNINVYRARPVLIVDDGKPTVVQSAYQSPRQIASGAGLNLFAEDEVSMSTVTDFVQDDFVGTKVVIVRARPVQIVIGANTYNFRTQAQSVQQLLDEHKIQVAPSDLISVSPTDSIYAGQRIVINRINQNVVAVSEPIQAATQVNYDDSLPAGSQRIAQAGSDGVRQKTYLVTYKDSTEIARSLLEDKVLKAATPTIVMRGRAVPTGSRADAVALAQELAADRGWTSDNGQWQSLYSLWTHEANFNPAAYNGAATGGACGIPQAHPCSKLPGYPGDAYSQIVWGLNYIASRYGTPTGAWTYWLSHGNY